MRLSGYWKSISVLMFVLALTQAHAQFQEPTADELKMTSDPKAPGAAAVYLYREETTDDRLHYHTLYERIKVLTEKGKELATVNIPYDRTEDKVTDIHARTIHADGTVAPLEVKPADLVEAKGKTFQVNKVVFTLPSVEVGSILEYRLQIRYPDERVSSPTWQIQQPYYVHKAHYEFKPFDRSGSRVVLDARGDAANRLMYSWRFDPKWKIEYNELKQNYTLNIEDVAPLPDEDWMPPLNTLRQKVEFYYTSATTGVEYWQRAGKIWSKGTNEFLDVNGGIKKIAAGLVAPTDSETDKAKKIYDAVEKLENTAFTRSKSEAERKKEKLREIKKTEDVWTRGGGSPDELALLFVALARGAGLKAWPVQVVDRNLAIFDPDFLSLRQLDDYLAIVSIDGKEQVLDPGQKACTFGQMSWKHALAGGLRESAAGSGADFVKMPSQNYRQNTTQRVADLTIGPDGALTGTVRIVMAGAEALYWRQKAIEQAEAETKKDFNEWTKGFLPEGVDSDFDHFLALEATDTNLIALVKVSGTLGTLSGKHMFLPEEFFAAHARHPFVAQQKREVTVDVHFPAIEQDQITYQLPEGFAVESAPKPASLQSGQSAVCKIGAKAEGQTVTVTRTLAYNFTLLDPKEYGPLHDFYQQVATADQQQLVLSKAASAKAGGQ